MADVWPESTASRVMSWPVKSQPLTRHSPLAGVPVATIHGPTRLRGQGGELGAPARLGRLAIAIDDSDIAWKDDAACRHATDPSIFFPKPGDSVREAKAICAGCPVRSECLDYALRLGEHGIWGSTSERERRRIRRERRAS